jgi:hypothetical protein
MPNYAELKELVDQCNQLILHFDSTDKIRYRLRKNDMNKWEGYREDIPDRCYDKEYLRWFIESYNSFFENRKGIIEKYNQPIRVRRIKNEKCYICASFCAFVRWLCGSTGAI